MCNGSILNDDHHESHSLHSTKKIMQNQMEKNLSNLVLNEFHNDVGKWW